MKTTAGNRPLVLVLILVMALSLTAPAALAESSQAATPQTDYYDYINADWLAAAKIRPDRASTSIFTDSYDVVLERLMGDFAGMAESGEETGNALLDMFLTYYGMVKDKETRNADGFAPAAADYARIEGLQSLEDYSAQMADWYLSGMPMAFGIAVSEDLEDVTRYMVHAVSASPIMPDPAFYEEGNPVGAFLLPLYQDMHTKLFLAAGATEEEAQAEVERAYAFDLVLVARAMSMEEQSDSSLRNNPVTLDEFAAKSEHFDLAAFTETLIGTKPETVNILNTKFYDDFDAIYSDENFENMKSWMKMNFLAGVSMVLSEDFEAPVYELSMLMSGAEELPDQDETDYELSRAPFSDVVGQYYGQTYFGGDAKADVTSIIESAMDIYRKRLSETEWLSEATREMAVRKLDTMSVRVGYPEKLPSVYDLYEITPAADGGTLYSNSTALSNAATRDMLAKYGTTPDRDQWITEGDVINAFYNPTDNSINFPAGFLQAPVYSPDQSESTNLGGIGMVIGHEISHAFDNNGALFDENGNMNNWWTDEDMAAFDERGEAMVALFDGLPYAGLTVNGRLTLGENIADAGGISCMVALVESLPDASLTEFFESYATIWRQKMTPEQEAQNLSDVHAPSKLRVNVQCSNCDAFYEAYEISEGDPMYIAPEDRVRIW